jgi:hypothetical protein
MFLTVSMGVTVIMAKEVKIMVVDSDYYRNLLGQWTHAYFGSNGILSIRSKDGRLILQRLLRIPTIVRIHG